MILSKKRMGFGNLSRSGEWKFGKKYLFLVAVFLFGFVSAASIDLDWIYPTSNIEVEQFSFFNVTASVGCVGGNCGEINVTLDPAAGVYNFTTCGASGKTGPNQTQCDTNYTGTNLEGLVKVDGGIQNWTVPASGTYTITACGAAGGTQTYSAGYPGGNGSCMVGDFSLTAGEVIFVLVGQKGEDTRRQVDNAAPGGGGGTFVYTDANADYPLIAAGGGGSGARCNSAGIQNANNETAGFRSGSVDNPGTNGNGGTSNSGGNSYWAGGGAGWLTNGTGGANTVNYNYLPSGNGAYGGQSPRYGGGGGTRWNDGTDEGGDGGFGGGGGGGSDNMGGGGGGGYSGGGGARYDPCGNEPGGGGGSFNNGTNQNNTAGINVGDGYVIFEFSGGKGGTVSTVVGTTPFYTNVTNPFNLTLNQDESSVISWWVNASGSLGVYEFFVYANKTDDESVGNITSKLNVTIIDTVAPVVDIIYPTAMTYDVVVTEINYSYVEENAGSCWYSGDGGVTNESVINGGINFTGLSSVGGTNTWILYCNDSSGNLGSDSVTFTSSVPVVSLTLLAPTGDVNVTFGEFFEVQARVSCSNNDCGEINVTLDPDSPEIIFSDDMESGEGDWTHGQTATIDEWEHGTPVTHGPSPFSGSNVWGTNLDAHTNYAGGRYWLKTPEFSLSGYTNSTLQFMNWYLTESCCDGGILEISTDDSTWTKIVPEGGYPGSGYSLAPWSNSDYAGSGNSWSVATFDLSAYDGNESVYVRFHFGADGSVNQDGWYIDDLNITGIGGVKSGVISMVAGTTPFYTNVTNPYNVSLNEDESATISWWVNATGDLNSTHEFFVYANKSSDESIGDISSKWNVTILENGTYSEGSDTSAPSITFVSPASNSFSSDSGLDIDLTISDPNLDSCWYSIDSGVTNTSLGSGGSCSDITSVTWSEGEQTVNVWANDTLANNASSSLVFTIDLTNPIVSFSSGTEIDNSKLARNNIYVDISVTETNEANVTFDLYYSNGTSVNRTTYFDSSREINWTGLSDGDYEFNVTVYDNASNSGFSGTRSVSIDTGKPLIEIISPSAETYTSSLRNFSLSSNENLSSCVFSLDDWITNYTMSLNSSFTGANYLNLDVSDGSYTSRFWCNDSFGNVNGSETVVFSVDTVNPVINIVHPEDNQFFNYNTSISLNYSVSADDADSCWYSVDGASNVTLSDCANVSLNFSEGNHLVMLWVNDSANLEGSDSVNFTIDLTEPLINLISPEDSASNNTANWIDFLYNVSDTNSVSNCSLIINDAVNVTVSGVEKDQTNNFTIYLLNGNYNWSVNCSDNSGNVNASGTRSFELNYTVVVDDSSFGGNSTDFDERLDSSELENVSNLTLEIEDYGMISFLENVDLSNDFENLVLNFSKHVNISANYIEVNSSALSGFVASARLSLYNITFGNPQAMKNGAVCSDCSEVSYSNNTFVFDITGFSFYSARETPVGGVSTGGGGSSGSSGGSSSSVECVRDEDCAEGYSCYENSCVKLFDVEIILINPLIDHLNFDLEYLIKGMAEINSDVIIEFWIEDEGEKIMLGKDTIYLGSFEEKRKTTKLNLPADLEDGDYDLYVQSGYENYRAQSFRKVNIRVPEETRIYESPEYVSEVSNLHLWVLIFFFALLIVLLLIKETRRIIIKSLNYLILKIKKPRMKVSFKEVDDEGILEEEEKVETYLSKPSEKKDISSMKLTYLNDLPNKKVYSVDGNFIGTIRKAILTKKRIYGWVIKPNEKYGLKKNVLVKHRDVRKIKQIFLVSKHVEKHLKKLADEIPDAKEIKKTVVKHVEKVKKFLKKQVQRKVERKVKKKVEPRLEKVDLEKIEEKVEETQKKNLKDSDWFVRDLFRKKKEVDKIEEKVEESKKKNLKDSDSMIKDLFGRK